MAARQILIPAAAFPRVADRLAALSDETGEAIEVLAWSEDGVVDADGQPVSDPQPEVAWTAIDLFFVGQFATFVDAALETGTVKWVQGCLAGTDAPPFARILQSGARLSPSDAPNAGVAEYVMAAVMGHFHGAGARIEAHRERRWAQTPWREINGTRWLVVGFGSIGAEVAQRARACGVEVIGARRTEVDDPRADRMITNDQLFGELPDADVVVLACPLTEETRGMVDAEFLASMSSRGVLVNVSRGAVIDTPALLDALDKGRPAAALLDVFEVEPLPDDSPLWDHPRVTMTSHVAGAGSGGVPRGDQVFLDQLRDYLADRPLRLEVR